MGRRLNLEDRFDKNRQMGWGGSTVYVVSLLLIVASLLMIPSVILATEDHSDILPFSAPMVAGICIAFTMLFVLMTSLREKDEPDVEIEDEPIGTMIRKADSVKKMRGEMSPADGIFLMFAIWMTLFIFGMIPYLLSGLDPVDAIFESVSGFATVGSSVIPDVTKCSRALLMWRTMTNWIGGIVIVSMFMFILPVILSSRRSLVKAEMFGARSGNYTAKMGSIAKQFLFVYVILTVVFAFIFVLCGLSIFDSVTLSMSTISIGGFTNTNDSLVGFPLSVKIAMIFMMMLSATNFYMHFRAILKKDFLGYKRSEEFKIMVIWLLAVSIIILAQIIALGHWNEMPGDTPDRVADVFFNVISVGTTAGFYTMHFNTTWSFIGSTMFVLLMFVGGSSGSPAGGIKISRAVILIKAMINEVRQEIHPNAVYTVSFDGAGVDKDAVHASIVVVLMFLLTTVVSTIIFNSFLKWDEALYTSVALVTATGTSNGQFFAGYATMPGWAKLYSCALMYLGRMEIVSVLAIFSYDFWRELLGPSGIKKVKDTLLAPGRAAMNKASKAKEARALAKEEKKAEEENLEK